MPIYEYKCRDCGAHIEKRQGVSEEPLKICEKCGGALEKQWSLSGIQFKGEGWYVTEYGGKKTDPAGKTEKSEKTGASESTTEAEPASNPTSDSSTPVKKDTTAKKDQAG
jgi:putative FmdB family regulatory protein